MAEKGLPRFQVSEMFRSGVYCQNFNKGGSLIYSLTLYQLREKLIKKMELCNCQLSTPDF